MAVEFERTLRSLGADRIGGIAWWGLLIVLAWVFWMQFAEVPVFETTNTARIEVAIASYPVATSIVGRIESSHLRLGNQVKEGDVLIKLESKSSELLRDEASARIQAIKDRKVSLQNEIQSEQATLRSIREGRESALIESRARVNHCEAQWQLNQQQAERLKRIQGNNIVSQSDIDEAQANLKKSQSLLEESKAALGRLRLDRLTAESECSTRIVRLESELVVLDGDLRIEQAGMDRLQQLIADHTVRSPVAGRLDQIAEIREGSVVTAAQKIAVVVPRGEPRIVAYYPVAAVGRIKKNQRARLRLDGFPWTQYGTVDSRVEEVGTEPESGSIRVELALVPNSNSRIPIEHGLTGSLQVEVERVSPGILALRAAGLWLGARQETVSTTRNLRTSHQDVKRFGSHSQETFVSWAKR